MKLNQLEELIAISSKGSFRQAARELKVTQPAMSRSIHRLEHELGVVLVARSGRGVTLTPIGERFVERASAALSELQLAREEISHLQGTGNGCVSACIAPGSAAPLLGKVIADFRARYPGVLLTVLDAHFTTIEQDLRNGRIDFYAGPEPATRLSDGLTTEGLHENPLIVVCRRGHPLTQSDTNQQLSAASWAAWGGTDQERRSEAVVVRCESMLALLAAVSGSDLLARIPLDLAAFAEAYGLDRIKLQEPSIGPRAVLICRRSLPLTPAAEYLSDLLRRRVAGVQ